MKDIKRAIKRGTGITKSDKGRWQKGDLEVVKLVINSKVVKLPKK